jgi:hypothetical protein
MHAFSFLYLDRIMRWINLFVVGGVISRVKPASFGLLCAWREVLILRQHTF